MKAVITVTGKDAVGIIAAVSNECAAQSANIIDITQTVLSDYFVMIMLLLIMSMLSSSICLPFIFKLGVEKGRMAYYVMIGIVCGGSVVASTVLRDAMQSEVKPNGVLALVCLIGIAIYALSWYLSIVFYKKREL